MKKFKTYAYIQSLNLEKLHSTEKREVEILEELPNNYLHSNI